MATMNFSVPDDVKTEFDRTFRGQNKSAIVTRLMRRAIAEAELTKRRRRLFNELTRRRSERPKVSNDDIDRARDADRP